MIERHRLARTIGWVMSIMTLLVITLCAGIVSVIVGDWLLIKTGNAQVAWGSGLFIFFGFLCALGLVIGIWLWIMGPDNRDLEEEEAQRLLADVVTAEKE